MGYLVQVGKCAIKGYQQIVVENKNYRVCIFNQECAYYIDTQTIPSGGI